MLSDSGNAATESVSAKEMMENCRHELFKDCVAFYVCDKM